jgi:hypothetical protein
MLAGHWETAMTVTHFPVGITVFLPKQLATICTGLHTGGRPRTTLEPEAID